MARAAVAGAKILDFCTVRFGVEPGPLLVAGRATGLSAKPDVGDRRNRPHGVETGLRSLAPLIVLIGNLW